MSKTITLPKEDSDKLKELSEEDQEILRGIKRSLQDVLDGRFRIA